MDEPHNDTIYWHVPDAALVKPLTQALKAMGLDTERVRVVDAAKDVPEAAAYIYRSAITPSRFGREIDQLRGILMRRPARAYAFGDYVLDIDQKCLRGGGADDIVLTGRECVLLEHLINAAGQPVRREDLLHGVWGYNENVETHTLETHIYRLRQKIERDPSAPEVLLTSDEGYRLNM